MTTCGVIVAAGRAQRLFPATLALSKHLLPVYDKPLIYYSLSALLLANIRDILIVTTPFDRPHFERLLGSGEQFGVRFSYLNQEAPKGIADALQGARDFIGTRRVCVVLGDNIFWGRGLASCLQRAIKAKNAAVLTKNIAAPQAFGVIRFNAEGAPCDIVEKPAEAVSNTVATGFYVYDNVALRALNTLQPSNRGELEISDLNRVCLQKGYLQVVFVGRSVVWFDAGESERLFAATCYVRRAFLQRGELVASPEEIAYRQGFISKNTLQKQIDNMPHSAYFQQLRRLLLERA